MGTVGQFIGALRNGFKEFTGHDDYDWAHYSSEYQAQLSQLEKVHTLKLRHGEYSFVDGELLQRSESLPLHPNSRLIYETILQLHPSSVMEIGFGSGDHLYNLMILSPETRLYGCDRSQIQVDFAKQRSPSLRADLRVIDASDQESMASLPRVDLCFTNAVLMHIRGKRYMTALTNVFRIASKHALLMENWTRHDFMMDIKSLHERRILPWSQVHFYYRISHEYGRPHLMAVSTELLNYPLLTDYCTLVKPLIEIGRS